MTTHTYDNDEGLPVFKAETGNDDGLPIFGQKPSAPEPVKKKETAQELVKNGMLRLGDFFGLIPSNSQSQKKPLTQVKNFKKTNPFDVKVDEHTDKAARNEISDIMYSDDDRWQDPLKTLNEKEKSANSVEDLNKYAYATNLAKHSLASDGFDAKKNLQLGHWTGATEKLLKQKGDQYDKAVEPLRGIKVEGDLTQANEEGLRYNYSPQVKNALIKKHAEENPQFKKELAAAKIDLNDPQLYMAIHSGKAGQIINYELQDPNVSAYLTKENPALAPAVEQVSKDNLTEQLDYGKAKVAEKVSRAVQKSGYNNIDPIFNFHDKVHEEFNNQIAEAVLNPEEKKIWDQHIRDHQEDYMDEPSFGQGFAEGGGGFLKGIVNTIKRPFTPISQTMKDKWDKESTNVSADPEGLSKALRDIGHGTGLVTAIAATGGESAILIGFFGDELEKAQQKYPDSPVKAWTSAAVNTTLFKALGSDVFPIGKVKQAFQSVSPEVDAVVNNLANGTITREAARQETNTIFKKAFDTVSEGVKTNTKLSAEMAGITAINKTMDKIMGADDSFHSDDEVLDTFKSMFLSNSLVAGLGGYGAMKGKNRLAEESIYEAATNPKRYERVIDESKVKDSKFDAESAKDNLEFVRDLKAELDAAGIDQKNQKRYLYESLVAKVAKENASRLPDANLTRKTTEGLQRGEDVRSRILSGEDVVANEERADMPKEDVGILERVDKSAGQGIKRTIDAADSETDKLQFLRDQALDTPNSLNSQLGGDTELTTDIIASNPKSLIEQRISDLTKELKNPDTDQQRFEEIDNHISLLEKGLEKAEQKPTVRITADQLEAAQPKTDEKPIEGSPEVPEQAKAPEEASIPEPTLEGGQTPPEIPTEPKETITIDSEGPKVGVHHEALSDLAKEIGLPEPERADHITPEEHAERGRKMMEAGASVEEVNNKNNDLHDRISLGRAYLEKYYNELNELRKSEGINGENYLSKKAQIEDLSKKIKQLGSKSGQAMTSLQGERDIDTDNFEVAKRNAEEKQGAPLSDAQNKRLQELTSQNEELKKRADEAEVKLIEATDRIHELEKEGSKKSKTEKAKSLADKLRKAKVHRPGSFSAATPASLVWDGAVEIIAKTIEAGGKLADALDAGIQHIKDSDWYKGISDEQRERAEKEFVDWANSQIEDTPEAKNIKRLEKELEDLRNGVAKQPSPKREYSEREKELKEQIYEEKKNLGLIKSKEEKPLTEDEQRERAEKEIKSVQEKFLNKKDDKFSPEESKTIWEYAKKYYLDKGVKYVEMIGNVANDLGLRWKQVASAITSPKTKPIADEMWKKQSDYRKNQNATKRWIDTQTENPVVKAWQKLTGLFRGVAVFGHGAIFVGTHSGMTLFDIPKAKHTIKAFLDGYKFAYGKKANYEMAMQELKSQKNYITAQRAGLKNNPERLDIEEYQRYQKYLGKLAGAGERGFNAIKVLRQKLFDYEYSKLTDAEKADPGAAKAIAMLINNATGATNLKIPEAINEITFAGGMEAARWGKLTRNPAKATLTAIKALTGKDIPIEDKVFAKVWAKRVGMQLATMSSMLLVNAAIQSLIDDKNKVNILNPNKPDWLKFKFGDMTVDPTSGMRGTSQFVYGLGKIPFQSKKERHGDDAVKSAGKSLAGYARGKLSPFYSTVADFYNQTDFKGNPLPTSSVKPTPGHHKLTWGEYLWQKAPLPVAEAATEMYNSALNNGADKVTLDHLIKGIISGGLSGGTGFRIGEYNAEESNHSPYTEDDNKKAAFKYFIDKGLELPNTALSSEDVTDERRKIKMPISEFPIETQEKYEEVHKDILEKELSKILRQGHVYVKIYSNGDKSVSEKRNGGSAISIDRLDKEDLEKILHMAHSEATKKAKEKVFPSYKN